MAQPYNLTPILSKTNPVELTQGANDLSNGLLGITILITFFIILVVSFKMYETKKGLAAASMLTALLSIFLRLLSMISDTWMFGSFLLTVICFVILHFSD